MRTESEVRAELEVLLDKIVTSRDARDRGDKENALCSSDWEEWRVAARVLQWVLDDHPRESPSENLTIMANCTEAEEERRIRLAAERASAKRRGNRGR